MSNKQSYVEVKFYSCDNETSLWPCLASTNTTVSRNGNNLGDTKIVLALQSSIVQYNNYSKNLLEIYIKPISTYININELKTKYFHLDRMHGICF
jgi:hypothetical protein